MGDQPSRIGDVADHIIHAMAGDGEPLVRRVAAQCLATVVAETGPLGSAVVASALFANGFAKVRDDVDWEVRWQVRRPPSKPYRGWRSRLAQGSSL
jgi:hypothetical protein